MQRTKIFSNLVELDNRKKEYCKKVYSLYSNYPSENKIGFPAYKILEEPGITIDVSTCCVILLFNECKKYFFGHFNSPVYKLCDDKTGNLFDDLKIGINEIEKPKAIVVAGNTLFFNEILAYLKRNNIEVVASYLDDCSENDIVDGFTDKTVTFDPTSKTAVVYSPVISAGKIELTNQNITLYDLEHDLIKGRAATIEFYLEAELRPELSTRASTPTGLRRFSFHNNSVETPETAHERMINSKEKSDSPSFRSLNLLSSRKLSETDLESSKEPLDTPHGDEEVHKKRKHDY